MAAGAASEALLLELITGHACPHQFCVQMRAPCEVITICMPLVSCMACSPLLGRLSKAAPDIWLHGWPETAQLAPCTPQKHCHLQDYLGWSGQWEAPAPELPTGHNEQLALVVSELSTAAAVAAAGAPLQAAAGGVQPPLRLALVGAPLAGKTTQARRLAEEHNLKVQLCRGLTVRLL